ncbi:hypothetical protein FZC84_21910 [Rossellomorea vietnamensis]|uniref:Uncharacterized protein n=1 Tax=Rossellomorea vietnamensis TaxID=218284 RepID=A0A5D4M052_9BACI|nr:MULTISPECIES: hypothetical protein [Bacillaceae]TYR95179.1 hypothetical protein FZC84_21910 [Rossellomorea vietnamensis]
MYRNIKHDGTYDRGDRMNTDKNPEIICPACGRKKDMEDVLTALSNQNVMYDCPSCGYHKKNIVTKKG